MREIKFRAWNEESKSMTHSFTLSSLAEFKGCHIVQTDSPIMQYTGRKDKTGKEIYEGDIMHIGSWKLVGKNPHAEVKYLQGFKVIVNYDLEEEPHTLVDCYVIQGGNATTVPLAEALQFFNEITIVGNIYENPELLKK